MALPRLSAFVAPARPLWEPGCPEETPPSRASSPASPGAMAEIWKALDPAGVWKRVPLDTMRMRLDAYRILDNAITELVEEVETSYDGQSPRWTAKWEWISKMEERAYGKFMQKIAEVESPRNVAFFVDFAAWLKSGKSDRKEDVERAKQEMLAEARCGKNDDAYMCQVGDYKTIQEFFTRELKAGERPFPADPTLATAPADGKIADQGLIRIPEKKKIKGEWMDFRRLAALNSEEARRFDGGSFLDLYLAPFNFHGYVSPYPGKLILTELVVLGGRERSVSGSDRRILERNVRVVAKFKDEQDRPFIVVFVSATAVARMDVFGHLFEPPMSLNYSKTYTAKDFPKLFGKSEIHVKRGESMGNFLLGSTVVILAPKDGGLVFGDYPAGRPIEIGQAIGHPVAN